MIFNIVLKNSKELVVIIHPGYFYISNPYGNGRSLVCTPSPGKKKRVKKTKVIFSEIRSK